MFVAERRLIEPIGLALANNVMPHGRNLHFLFLRLCILFFYNFIHEYTAFIHSQPFSHPHPIPLDVGDRQHRRNLHVLIGFLHSINVINNRFFWLFVLGSAVVVMEPRSLHTLGEH